MALPGSTTDRTPHWKRTVRVLVYVLGALILLAALNECSKTINTLNALRVIESQRDQWQRPADVIAAMNLAPGNMAADVGSGAGYFALKLSNAVGGSGEVFAVDIQRFQLFFAWLRARLDGRHNVQVRVGGLDDPHLPIGRVDAVLVANTYHEFANPGAMLQHIFDGLRPGGRLVIVDRSSTGADSHNAAGHGHELAPDAVRTQLLQRHFEILEQDDRFIQRPDGERWWIIIARKPVQ